MSAFGDLIAARRKALKLTQKELAPQIKKADGTAISSQYLNDIERDRRALPTDVVLESLAQALKIPTDVLYFLVGRLPPDVKRDDAPEERILAAFSAFRRELAARSVKKKKS
jgi:transcriptional regulator with XRE-family HTH domain